MPVTKSDANDAIAREEKKLAAARRLNIDPKTWFPPETPPLEVTVYKRFFEKKLPDCTAIAKKRLEPYPDRKRNGSSQSQSNSKSLPNPFSDFSHVTKGEKHFTTVMSDPNLREKNNANLAKLRLVFDFIVCRTAGLCFEINKAVSKYDPEKSNTCKAYDAAREAYITFVNNLDNPKPKKTVSKEDLNQGLGYGRNYTYIFVVPTIRKFEGTALITGVTIILEWNPHSSSSGIPIKHL